MTSMGLPAAIVLLVMIAEFFGSLGLITGFLGRVSAFGIFCVMLGAIFTVHLPNGFFMNWMGNQKGEGFEYHLLAIGMALAVMVKGSGRFSIDRWLSKRGE
ncbi:MAG: DoxX family protein, partial [Acidobacteriota bacterium]